jgi:hypothetical protein
MKRGIYDSLAAINQGFSAVPDNLETLRDLGVITPEYVEHQRVLVEELRAGINSMILNQQQVRELEDRDHYGKMKASAESKQHENDFDAIDGSDQTTSSEHG